MKTYFVAASMLMLGIASASAADLAARPYVKAPPIVAATTDWSGFYVGANGGGGWSRNCWDIVPFTIANPTLGVLNFNGPEGCHTASGATAGGQIGYRWQHAAWVFGLEAQGNWADLSGSNPSIAPLFTGFENRTKIDAIGLFTGQIGYSWGAFLLYAKGGAAVMRDRYESVITPAFGLGLPVGFIADRGSETRWGGVIGAGAEYAIAHNWSMALEYDHLFMGTDTVHLTYDPAFIAAINHDERVRQDVDMVTVRVNYRFGGPVVAKY
ncbi:outer membrane beta-barrel protein [Bradyrhizobium tropiciagri]|uniref:outer membrane protein n=1 Tax=Bradyrhizobium tropiciagri TaxID=312253 RepID=UPI001BA715EA|nr:outer membrane beta-barrel protein [Bradyrhizobium tropiciagri]MBR0895577.1 outer membrane beta-barrel protein [Bradyrhizobium tropiciagri]